MLAEACLQTLANGLFETWKCPVYIIELPSRKHFSASFVVEPEHQQIFRVATNTSQKKSAENDQFW